MCRVSVFSLLGGNSCKPPDVCVWSPGLLFFFFFFFFFSQAGVRQLFNIHSLRFWGSCRT